MTTEPRFEYDEFWGPRGMGCSWCHDGAPVVFGMAWKGPRHRGALCPACLERCLGWPWDRIEGWLVAQRTAFMRREARAAAIRAARRGYYGLVRGYSLEYGVELLR